MPTHNKVLRIGIIQGGKIVEERLLKSRHAVTIGTGPKNTIVIPQSNLPASFTVFPMAGEVYQLAFTERMEGRIQSGQGQADFGALVAQGLAKKQGEHYTVPIHDEQRGKVVLGEVTLLWQFVAPPPPAVQPVLPDAAKGGVLRSIDRVFTGILAVSIVCHFGVLTALAKQPPREEVTLEEIPDRIAKILIPEKKQEPPKVEKKAEVAAEAKKEAKDDAAKKEKEAMKTPEGQAKHAAAVKTAVASKGLLKVLGALGPGTGQGAVADVFGHGGGMGDVATALAGAGGVAIATDPGGGSGRKGGEGGGPATIGDLATSGGAGGKVGYGTKSEVRVSGSVSAEAAEVDSADIDSSKLGAFIRARQGAIKNCYEAALKRNPTLKGKIRIRFTILETGGISEISAIENSLGSSEVAGCIISIMRTWRTPFKPSGSATVEFPFVFSPSN
jgi:outer membrane biosynthesis protein TonB